MKKKIIIAILIVIITLLILFYPYEKMTTSDGGSTTYYKTLILNVISYDRPAIGSKTYKKGKIIILLGKEIFNDVVELANPNFANDFRDERYNIILSNIGESKTYAETATLISKALEISEISKNNDKYDKITIIDNSGNIIKSTNSIPIPYYQSYVTESELRYNIEVIDKYDYGIMKTIRVTFDDSAQNELYRSLYSKTRASHIIESDLLTVIDWLNKFTTYDKINVIYESRAIPVTAYSNEYPKKIAEIIEKYENGNIKTIGIIDCYETIEN